MSSGSCWSFRRCLCWPGQCMQWNWSLARGSPVPGDRWLLGVILLWFISARTVLRIRYHTPSTHCALRHFQTSYTCLCKPSTFSRIVPTSVQKSTFGRIVHTSRQKSKIINCQNHLERNCYGFQREECCRRTITIITHNNKHFTEWLNILKLVLL